MKNRTKTAIPALILSAAVMLSGCVRTVDELYQVPRRSEGYQNLQAVMDRQLEKLSYCAPVSGDNQQAVQMADLDGDGTEEVLLFAKGEDDRPLKIVIFTWNGEEYRISMKIERAGTSFDQVEYVQMDGKPGLEMVIGTELSTDVLRNVAVYRFEDDRAEKLLSSSYRKFLCCDMDENGTSELLVLSSEDEDPEHGTVELYGVSEGMLSLWGESRLSQSVEQMKRIMTGGLSGGQQAVFVASAVDAKTVVTDVFALVDGEFANVSQSGVRAPRNFYVYGEDINHDGEMELPSLIPVRHPQTDMPEQRREHLIRWYSLTAQGEEVVKGYTYHNYQQQWYMKLQAETAERMCVVREESGAYSFFLWDEAGAECTKLWTVWVLTGEDRSAQADQDHRFVLLKTDSTVYAGEITREAEALGLTQQLLKQGFHLIQREWKTGEM